MRCSTGAGALFLAMLVAAASCSQGSEPEGPASPGAMGPTSPNPSSGLSSSPSPSASPAEAEPRDTWSRSLGFSAEAVSADGQGDVYVTGFAPYGPAEGSGRSVAMVLERYRADGEQVWVRRWRSRDEMYTDAAGFDVAVSPDGDIVYVAGEILIPPWEARLVRLWAYSSDGDLLWSRQTDRVAFGAVVGASSTGAVVGGLGWLAAWSLEGDPMWVASFEDPAGEHCDAVEDVAVGDRDEVFAVGYLDTTPTCGDMEGGAFEDADVAIQRRSASGDLVWSRVLTDPGVDNDWGRAVDVVGDAVYAAGEQDGRAWLARLSSDGDVVWARSWGAPGMPVQTAGVSAASWDAIYVLAGRGPLILRRYTLEGDLGWDRRLRLGLVAEGVATAPDGALFVVAGDFSTSGELRRMRP